MVMKCVLLVALAFVAQFSHAFVVPVGSARLSNFSKSNVRRGAASTSIKAAAKDGAVETAQLVLKKPQLAAEVAEVTGLNKTQSEAAVAALLDTIMNTVADGGKVNLQGFGSFEGRARKSRMGRNPRTGEELTIAATTAPAFTPSKSFKELVKSKHVP